MSKTAIWVIVSFIGGTLFTAILNAAGVDLYKVIRNKVKRDDLEVLPSKRLNGLSVPLGYQGHIPHKMGMDIFFNIRNHSASNSNVEAVSVKFDENNLPTTIMPLFFDDKTLQSIEPNETINLKATFNVDMEVRQGAIQDNFNDFILFLEAIPADLKMSVTVTYLNKGKHSTTTGSLLTNVQKTMANNWLEFLKTQSFGNPDLTEVLENTFSKLRTMVS